MGSKTLWVKSFTSRDSGPVGLLELLRPQNPPPSDIFNPHHTNSIWVTSLNSVSPFGPKRVIFIQTTARILFRFSSRSVSVSRFRFRSLIHLKLVLCKVIYIYWFSFIFQQFKVFTIGVHHLFFASFLDILYSLRFLCRRKYISVLSLFLLVCSFSSVSCYTAF